MRAPSKNHPAHRAAHASFDTSTETANRVLANAITGTMSRCKEMMRDGEHPTAIAQHLRTSYRGLTLLSAAAEVIADEQHDPAPFVLADETDDEGFHPHEPCGATVVPFTPLVAPRNRAYVPVAPDHSRRGRRG